MQECIGATIRAMNLNQLAGCVSMGCFLIILGLVPGLLCWIQDQIQQIYESLCPWTPTSSRQRGAPYNRLLRPRWLARLGVALIFASIIAYQCA